MDSGVIKECLKLLRQKHNMGADTSLEKIWCDVFSEIQEDIFKRACEKFFTADKFPGLGDMICECWKIKHELDKAKKEKSEEYLTNMAGQQIKCYLCDNTGFCVYEIDDYTFASRCVCAHGSDLNRFSRAQLEAGNQNYLPTVKEVLGEQFELFNAQRKARKLESANLTSDEERLNMLNNLTNAIGSYGN